MKLRACKNMAENASDVHGIIRLSQSKIFLVFVKSVRNSTVPRASKFLGLCRKSGLPDIKANSCFTCSSSNGTASSGPHIGTLPMGRHWFRWTLFRQLRGSEAGARHILRKILECTW